MRSPTHSHDPRPDDTVTIGIPVYNGARYIAETLESVLAQTYENVEIIVSDNASTDTTPEIVEAFAARDPRVRFRRNARNVGAYANFEQLLREARGEYFAWLGADDHYAPTFVERCVELIRSDGQVVGAMSGLVNFDGKGNDLVLEFDEISTVQPWSAARRHFFDCPSRRLFYLVYAMYRTKALRAIRPMHHARWGGFASRAEDAFLAQMAVQGRIVSIPEVLYHYRRHPDSIAAVEHSALRRLDHHILNASILAEVCSVAVSAPLPIPTRWELTRHALWSTLQIYVERVVSRTTTKG